MWMNATCLLTCATMASVSIALVPSTVTAKLGIHQMPLPLPAWVSQVPPPPCTFGLVTLLQKLWHPHSNGDYPHRISWFSCTLYGTQKNRPEANILWHFHPVCVTFPAPISSCYIIHPKIFFSVILCARCSSKSWVANSNLRAKL